MGDPVARRLAMLGAAALWTAVAGCAGSRGASADAGVVGAGGRSGGAAGMVGGGGGGAGGAAAGGGGGASASVGIVVDMPSGRVATEAQDGHCDLLEAIQAANTDLPVHECPAGHGADRIILTAGASYPVKKTLRIAAPVSIGLADGERGVATIAAAPEFTVDSGAPWSDCLVHAASPEGPVNVTDVMLSTDPALTITGACVSSGSFQLRRGQVSGFRKRGIVAYCLPELGCDQGKTSRDSTVVSILGSLISDNRGAGNGGGIYTEGRGAVLVVEHSSIIDNVAQNNGGGLYLGGDWATHQIRHSTVSGNAALSGAGVFVSFASCTASHLYVFNSTITRNIATYTGGGLEFHGNEDCSAQDVMVRSSIIAGNTSTTSQETNINTSWIGGMFGCQGGSLIYVLPGLATPAQQPGTAPCRYDVDDPVLAPLAGMGGPGDLPVHVPRRGSPVIDAAAGDDSEEQQRDEWVSRYDTLRPPEWRLFERVVDGDGDGTATRDLGAYEVDDAWQTELLFLSAAGAGSHRVVTSPDGYQRGAGTAYLAVGDAAAFVTYVVPMAEGGGYSISVRIRQAPDGGRFQVAVADSAAGPWTDLGPEQDAYAAADAFATLNLSDGHTFGAAGRKLFRLTVTGQNPASAGRALYLDSIRLKQLR